MAKTVLPGPQAVWRCVAHLKLIFPATVLLRNHSLRSWSPEKCAFTAVYETLNAFSILTHNAMGKHSCCEMMLWHIPTADSKYLQQMRLVWRFM